MRPWIVTGLAGHLGNFVVRQRLEAGLAARAWVHERDEAIRGLGCEIVQVDVRDDAAGPRRCGLRLARRA